MEIYTKIALCQDLVMLKHIVLDMEKTISDFYIFHLAQGDINYQKQILNVIYFLKSQWHNKIWKDQITCAKQRDTGVNIQFLLDTF